MVPDDAVIVTVGNAGRSSAPICAESQMTGEVVMRVGGAAAMGDIRIGARLAVGRGGTGSVGMGTYPALARNVSRIDPSHEGFALSAGVD